MASSSKAAEEQKIQAQLVHQEMRYQVISPPILCALDTDSVHIFLKAYSRYESMRKKDNLPVQGLKECIDGDLTFLLEFRDGDLDDDDKVMTSDASLLAYLKQEEIIDDPEELINAFSAIEMDMKVKDAKQRVSDYDIRFLAVRKRASGIDNLKQRQLVTSHVNGVRPRAVQNAIENVIQWRELSLNEVMSITRDRVESQEAYFRHNRTSGNKESVNDRRASEQHHRNGQHHNEQHHHNQQNHDAARANGGKSDHHPNPSSSPAASTPSHERADSKQYDMRKRSCNRCGGDYFPGHNEVCPKQAAKNKDHRKPGKSAMNVESDLVAAVARIPGPVSLTVKIANEAIKAVLDTGASTSCISKNLAERLSYQTEVVYKPTNTKLTFADGRSSQTRIVHLSITVPTPRGVAEAVTLAWDFHELPDSESNKDKILIGTDMLGSLGMVEGTNIVIPLERDEGGQPEGSLDDEIDDVIDEVTEVYEIEQEPYGGEEYLKVVIPDSVIADKAKAIVAEYKDVFDPILVPGEAKIRPMPINLMSDAIVHIPPRRLKPGLREQVEDHFAEAQRKGLITQSRSPYSAPVVIARKKDGSIRPCFDYSVVNGRIVPHEYPLASIQNIWHNLMGNEFFGTGDMRSGFNQMLVVPEHRHITAFSTEDRHSETVAAYFGMKNTPAYFQEGMDAAFEDLIRVDGFGQYIDDTSFAGRTGEDFLRKLRLYLERCRTHRFKLKAEKCVFGAKEVPVLGCIISKEGRRISPERVTAVRSLAPPADVRELRMFIGKVLFFQDMIPNLHRVAAPLYELEKKNVAFVWTDVHNVAFETLKNAITDEIVLGNPTDPGQLVLRTDASTVGIGGVLLLRTPDHADKPICFFSHKFNDTQRRWSTFDQEMFAILYCITRNPYRSLLKLRHFIIETDHRNLQFLSSVDSDRNTKLTRWKMILLEYSFEITHIAGTSNTVADCLSRYGMGRNSEQGAELKAHVIKECLAVHACSTVEEANRNFWDGLRKLQVSMPTAGLSKDTNGLLTTASGLFVIPDSAKDIKKLLLKTAHGGPFTGHQGSKRCCDTIHSAGFHWDDLDKEVAEYIASCPVCQKVRLHPRTSGTMLTTSVDQVLHTLAIDTVGPFATDEYGNKYILVMVDVASRICRMKATRQCDAVSAAEAILSEWVARLGVPQCIRSDNGTQFANGVIDALCSALHIKHHFIMPYQPQSNGVVERTNGEIMRHLRCLLFDADRSTTWSHMIPFLEFIINNSVHGALGVSPNSMIYGNMVTNRFDFPQLIAQYDGTSLEGKAADYIKDLQDQLLLIRESARRAQDRVLQERSKRYNKQDPTEYHVGDFVLLKRTHDTIPAKLQALWLGPYKVVDIPAPQVYKLQSLFDPQLTQEVHHMRLIPFNLRDDVTMSELADLAERDNGEFVVDKVVGHEGFNKRDIRFLIHWLGYPSSEDTWQSWSDVQDDNGTNSKVEEYIRASPELLHLLRTKGRNMV